MAEPKFFKPDEIEALLAPISEEQPTGVSRDEDSKLDSEWRAVFEARDAAANAEKEMWKIENVGSESEDPNERPKPPKPPDWQKVCDLSVSFLSQRSKDLWVTAWLIEGLVRVQGFRGLHDGFRVARELCERYWDGLQPRPDLPEDEQEEEVLKTLVKLDLLNDVRSNVNLVTQFDQVPITESKALNKSSPARALNSFRYKQALAMEESTDADYKTRLLEKGAVKLADFERIVAESSPDFYLGLMTDLDDCLSEFSALHETIRKRIEREDGSQGSQPPGADNIRTGLETCLDRVKHLAGQLLDSGGQAAAEGDGDSDEEGSGGGGGGGKGGAPGQIRSRDDAFKALLKVSEYFRKAEPHSPISYALEQAVRWGKMSLPDLLADLVPNKEVLSEMFLRTGIVPKKEENE